MHPQPLLLERTLGLQVLLAVVLPALFGLLTGYVLGVSEAGYLVLSVVALVGGTLGGFDHDGAGEGAVRGFCAGLLFGVFILVGHALFGQRAKADLPEPYAVLVVITTVLGIAFHAIGGALRARRERGARAAAA